MRSPGGLGTATALLCAALMSAACAGDGVATPPRAAQSTAPVPSRTAPAPAPTCRAASLRIHGGREGEETGAHGAVQITNVAPTRCELIGRPRVSLRRADNTVLMVRQQSTPRPAVHTITLAADGGRAWLALFWINWCHGATGPLDIALTLPRGAGTVVGPFDGPPAYNYVPQCLAPHRPSMMQIVAGYTGHP